MNGLGKGFVAIDNSFNFSNFHPFICYNINVDLILKILSRKQNKNALFPYHFLDSKKVISY